MASSQNQLYPTQSQTPDYDKAYPNAGNNQGQNAPVPPQNQTGNQYQYPPPIPPGTYTQQGTLIYPPQHGSWVSNGASVAGVVIAGRCLIGFVSSGIMFIIMSLIMFVQANNLDDIGRGNNISFTNPLRILAPIFLVLGLVFLTGGLMGICFAMKAVKKQRAQAVTTTTSTVTVGAPIISGRPVNPNYGQQNQPYNPQGAQLPQPSSQGGYPQQSYGQAPAPVIAGQNVSSQDQNEAPPPYQPTVGPNAPLQKY